MRFALVLALVLACAVHAEGTRRYKIGVTLHPYYSWVARVVADTPIDVVPVLSAGADSHGYQASPDDIKRIAGLDAIVINGLGHDDFVKPMIAAAGNANLSVVSPNEGIPLIPYNRGQSHTHGGEAAPPPTGQAYNPHTFLSITGAIQQVYAIEAKLSTLWPAYADRFRANAAAYARKLRGLKADALAKLKGAKQRQVATVHDGYCYLLQEMGLEVVTVIEPAHGVEPSAAELAKTIDAIKAAGVKVVFSELSFPARLVDVIRKESGAAVYTFDHMNTGDYAAEQFETAMKANLDTLVRALQP